MDISSLRERYTDGPFSVTELNNFIKGIFDSNRLLGSISVKGEISNFKRHSSGHLYFSLKDEGGQVRAVMFRSRVEYLKFLPENGMKVIIHGSVTVYPKDGSYQIYVSSMQPDGIGALYLAYEQLKAKLEAEGLFREEYKKTIPEFPMKIGVITSPTGAAVRDIINVTKRRFPLATVYLYPALVQGDGAERSIIRALDYFEASSLVDVIIVGRGGGSIEDLWAFNGEELARRIFAAKTPIISAVGHETDFTICDFVSDLRAPTPSAAAEIAVPDIRNLIQSVDDLADRAALGLVRLCEKKRAALDEISTNSLIESPNTIIDQYRELLGLAMESFIDSLSSRVTVARSDFSTLVAGLNALNPLSVLARGYSVTTIDGTPVLNSSEVSVGDEIETRVKQGKITSTITQIMP